MQNNFFDAGVYFKTNKTASSLQSVIAYQVITLSYFDKEILKISNIFRYSTGMK